MKVNISTKIFLIIGSIILVATNLIFFITQEGNILPHVWLGFSFMILAELVFIIGNFLIEKYAENRDQIILRAGGGTVIVIYSLLAFIVSFIYLNNEFIKSNIFIVLHIILFAIALILEILFFTISKSVYGKER